MEKRQQRTVRAFEQTLIFLQRYPISPEPPLLTGMRKSLRASIDRIRQLGVTQMNTVTLDGGKVNHRRQHLRRTRMMPLVRIAKPLLAFAPGVEKPLRIPHARADALTVAESALALAKMLKPHQKLLRSAGYPPTFLAELQHEARELALAAKRTAAARQAQAKATAAIAREFAKGMQTVSVIEGLVMLHLAKDEAALDMWRWHRRVGARVGRPPRRRGAGSAGPMTEAQPPVAIPPS
jgi:hypothetical protein